MKNLKIIILCFLCNQLLAQRFDNQCDSLVFLPIKIKEVNPITPKFKIITMLFEEYEKASEGGKMSSEMLNKLIARLLSNKVYFSINQAVFNYENAKNDTTTALKGIVIEKKTKEPIIDAYVNILQNEIVKYKTRTDEDGNFFVKINPGVYDVEVKYILTNTMLIKGIIIQNKQKLLLNIEMENSKNILDTISFSIFCPPIIHQDNTTSGATYESWQISRSPR